LFLIASLGFKSGNTPVRIRTLSPELTCIAARNRARGQIKRSNLYEK
jgi:hypothetical protein